MAFLCFKHLSLHPEIHTADGVSFYLCDYTKQPVRDAVGLPDFLCKKGGVKKSVIMRGRFADWNVLWRFVYEENDNGSLEKADYERILGWLHEHANAHNNRQGQRRFEMAPRREDLALFGGAATADQYFGTYDRFLSGSVKASQELAIRLQEKQQKEEEAAQAEKKEKAIITTLPLAQVKIPAESTSLHIIEFAVIPAVKTALVRQTNAHTNQHASETVVKHLARIMGVKKLGVHFSNEDSEWVAQRPTTYTKAQQAHIDALVSAGESISEKAAADAAAAAKTTTKKRRTSEKTAVSVLPIPDETTKPIAEFKRPSAKRHKQTHFNDTTPSGAESFFSKQ